MELLALGKIRTDGGTQMRVSISNDTMLDYRDKWRSGVVFDPIDVFFDGTEYWLADGFHRFYGAREAKRKDIQATLHNGTVREAILFACGANLTHGLRRTNPDKRHTVEVLLADDEWAQWSDRVIADKCGVGKSLVGEVRSQLVESANQEKTEEKPAPPKRRGKDGKQYKGRKPKRKLAVQRSETSESTNGKQDVKEPTPFDHLKHWWGKADATQKCLFRNWIDGKL